MIHLIQGRKRLLFFPKSLVNSIVRWIAGVHSPSGTIKIGNTMNPSDESSIALDVNVEAVTHEVLEKFETRPVTNEECKRMKQHLRGMVDGSSVQMSDGHVSVNGEWVDNRIREYNKQDKDGDGEPQNPTELSSGYPVGGTAEQKTDTFTASLAPNAKGVKVHLLCRGADAQDGEHVVFAWRPFLITNDGRVYSIGAEESIIVEILSLRCQAQRCLEAGHIGAGLSGHNTAVKVLPCPWMHGIEVVLQFLIAFLEGGEILVRPPVCHVPVFVKLRAIGIKGMGDRCGCSLQESGEKGAYPSRLREYSYP